MPLIQERLRILLVGNGGREHALAWKLSQSSLVDSIYVVPGNGGTGSAIPKVANIDDVSADDFPALVVLAKKHGINLVVPGPEAPLVAGIEGYFRAAGIRCFGPSKAAARMEGSKTFSKDFMARHQIPTAEFRNFSDYNAAKEYIDSIKHDVVIKADGLAGGKGVIIPKTKEEAQAALKEIMLNHEFGNAGDEVVIEEYLDGDELSILTFSDGYTLRSLPPAQDHKRIFDGDQGPNTGGMGCYAPTRIASEQVIEEIHRTILEPTIKGMRQEAFPFCGVLFTGLMMTKNGPKVLEYNTRFGDPETQTLLPLISADTDLAEVMVACTERWLDAVELKVEPKFAATVVVSAGGYPGSYAKGTEMTLDERPEGIEIFHAGTTIKDGKLRTSGGRVIAASATAETLEEAVKRAYDGVATIHFDKMFYRKDIAHRAFGVKAPKEAMTYASAGVSIDAGNDLVHRIKSAVRSTKRTGADAEIGGFGGTFDLERAGYSKIPVLIGAIDGVGTKLKVAQAIGKQDTVGIDLVAMNVNDLVVQGAEALFFLDCYSCSKLDVGSAASFVEGVAEGCRQANCALVGGETAEMPGLYSGSEYDAVGAAVGAVQKDRILPNTASMEEGDVLLGLGSNGVHSNGFSLVRKIIERNGLSYESKAPWDETTTVGLSLLTPTRIYVKPLLQVIKQDLVKGMAHITGGGLFENIPRMLPDNLTAEVDASSWTLPAVLTWLKKAGNVTGPEFGRAFNTGLGMVIVVSKEKADETKKILEAAGEKVFQVGKLVKRTGEGCVVTNMDKWDA
ncbi:phosphoribosylamine--glycine ligase [Xylona heveae TC161]|uniref:Phosphoribosylamine--glycine ligase n=1 Tax=Xylona heveae (strain CBS 132557 / TC161) TaxID=1328760 RepID=A0A165FSQ9_XYLHT|nr:phosphoribosylamine--glycine ligase [Xylona heveae TC161]KZF21330.1 phosphoribosylamine--glycine ligase [Xylona heveae TC161]